MEKEKLLDVLKSYADEHMILDHKGDYVLKDHRWHARELDIKTRGGTVTEPSLFSSDELGGAHVVKEVADFLPHLPHYGLSLKPLGLDAPGPLAHNHGYRLDLDDPEKMSAALMGDSPDENFRTPHHHIGHIVGTLEGITHHAQVRLPRPHADMEVSPAVYVQAGDTARDMGDTAGALSEFKWGMSNALNTQGVPQMQGLARHGSDEEAKAKVLGLDEDDWQWQNTLLDMAPQDPDDWGDYLETKGVDEIKTKAHLNDAKYYLDAGGAPEESVDAFIKAMTESINGDLPTKQEDISDWLQDTHDIYDGDVSGVIQGVEELRMAGVDKALISEWISGKLNVNTSDGGAVNDDDYDKRTFDPQKAGQGVREEIAYHAGEIYEQTMEDDPEQEGVTPPPAATASAAEMLAHPSGRTAMWQAVESYVSAGDEPGGHGLRGMQGWGDDTAMYVGKLEANWDAQPAEAREQYYRDTARYIDATQSEPRMVLSDDGSRATSWLDPDAGGYRFSRYSTVPPGDGETRTEREDSMGIGRVNYAAHGFDAALPPIIKPRNARGDVTYTTGPEMCIPSQDAHGGECADFGTMGYGDSRFSFAYPSYPISHAVNDTYMDARYCPNDGFGAVLTNAPSFAHRQQQYKVLAEPNQGAAYIGSYSDQIPNFIELHPRDMDIGLLRQVQLRDDFQLKPHVMGYSGGLRRVDLVDQILKNTSANVLVTPNNAHFWPPDFEHHDAMTGGTAYNRALIPTESQWTEQKARELIEATQEQLLFRHGERAKLYVPMWAR